MSKLREFMDAEAAKAVKAGEDIDPSGTYTLSNRDASAVALSLSVVACLLRDDIGAALSLIMAFRGKEELVANILEDFSHEITEKQCPAFIKRIADGETTAPAA